MCSSSLNEKMALYAAHLSATLRWRHGGGINDLLFIRPEVLCATRDWSLGSIPSSDWRSGWVTDLRRSRRVTQVRSLLGGPEVNICPAKPATICPVRWKSYMRWIIKIPRASGQSCPNVSSGKGFDAISQTNLSLVVSHDRYLWIRGCSFQAGAVWPRANVKYSRQFDCHWDSSGRDDMRIWWLWLESQEREEICPPSLFQPVFLSSWLSILFSPTFIVLLPSG